MSTFPTSSETAIKRCFYLAPVLVFVSFARASAAVPVGVDFSNNSTQFSESNGTIGVNLGGSPVPVGPTLSPSAQPWNKTFTLNSPNSGSPNLVNIDELLRFFPPQGGGSQLPVVEWREQILTPGFVWTSGTLTELNLGQIFVRTVGNGTVAGGDISFQFAGTPITSDQFLYRFTKQMQWTGGGPRPSSVNVRQYPLSSVPEPGTFVIASIVIIWAVGRRGRYTASPRLDSIRPPNG